MQEIRFIMLLWFFSGFPLIVSFILTLTLKYRTSTKILFVSTIAYGIWFAYVFCAVFLSGETCGMQFLVFGWVGPFSLPVMIPAWIAAYVVEVRQREPEQPEPEWRVER
jgi:hypothetical protein